MSIVFGSGNAFPIDTLNPMIHPGPKAKQKKEDPT